MFLFSFYFVTFCQGRIIRVVLRKTLLYLAGSRKCKKRSLSKITATKKERKKEEDEGKASALRCVLFQTLEKRNTHYSLLTPSVFSGWTETTHIPTNKHHGEPARRENQHEKKHNVHGCKGKEQEREEAAKVRKAKAEETKEWRIPTTT